MGKIALTETHLKAQKLCCWFELLVHLYYRMLTQVKGMFISTRA